MRKQFTYIAEALETLTSDVDRIDRISLHMWDRIKEEDAAEIIKLAEEAGDIVDLIKLDTEELLTSLATIKAMAINLEEGEPVGFRTCSACGAKMAEGYIVDDCEYYCSDDCLHTKYTPEEYAEMYENDIAFWTEWSETT